MNLYIVSLSFTSFCSFILSGFVIYKNPKGKINQTWGLASFFCGIWSLFFVFSLLAPNQETANLLAKILNIAASYMIVFVAHFCKEMTSINRKNKNLIHLGYLGSAIVTLTTFTSHFCTVQTLPILPYYTKSNGVGYWFFTAHFFFYALYGEYLLVRELYVAGTEKKNQIHYILIGLTLGYIGGFISFLPTYGIMVNLTPMHFIWLYAAMISYAILKHRLMDIEIVIQKTFFYTFWTLALSVFYALMIVLMQAVLSGGIFFDIHEWKNIEILIYRWSGAFALLINLGLAAFVRLHDSQSNLCRKFSLLSLCIGFWAAGSWWVNVIPDQTLALTVLKLNYAFGVFVPVIFLDFTNVLTDKNTTRHLVRIGYAVSAGFAISLFATPFFIEGLNRMETFNYKFVRPGPIHDLFVGYFCMYLLTGLGVLIMALQHAAKEKAFQFWYVFLAYLIGLVAGLEYFLSVYGILKRPPLDDYILAATFGLLCHAISKHTLLDIKTLAKKTLFYSSLAFTISTAYVVIVFITHKFFIRDTFTRQHLVASLALILFITLLLRPAESFLRRWLDKRFFKGTIEEISEQKERLESELERQQRLKSVGILAAGMAHEIKNPLTVIQTFTEHLPEKYGDSEFREKFTRIVSGEIRRMKEIVSDLLVFSKPGEPNKQRFSLDAMIRSLVDLVSSEALKAGVSVKVEVDECVAYADAGQVRQALLNIFLNAIDSMRGAGGELRIFASKQGGKVRIDIKDTGEGIPPERLAHIFDPFYTTKDIGTGLGLAITHSIIEKNSGQIVVRSVIGQGSEFSIFLPS